MNDLHLYSILMFVAGVILTKAVFYYEQKFQQKKFYLTMSAAILQILDAAHSSHVTAIEVATAELKKIETAEETEVNEYLEKESNKVLIFMELYTLLLTQAVPKKGRKYINYKSWPQASALIGQLRGLKKDGENKS